MCITGAPFLFPTLDGGELSASHSYRYTPGERAPDTGEPQNRPARCGLEELWLLVFVLV
jgi:hypothetical protein